MVQRIQPYILLLSLVTALWLLFYLRFVYEVSFMSLFIEQYTCSRTSPAWLLIVVGHLRDIEQQHVSSEKSLGHILTFGRELFHAILNIQVT